MSELANLAAGPARTSQLSVARELFFVLRALPPWAGRAPRWLCVCRDVLVGLLSGSLWPGQEHRRCEGRGCSGSARCSRSLRGGRAQERSQGLQEELGLRGGSSAPPGRQRQKEQHVRGWRAPAKPRGQRLWPLQGAAPSSQRSAVPNVGSVSIGFPRNKGAGAVLALESSRLGLLLFPT